MCRRRNWPAGADARCVKSRALAVLITLFALPAAAQTTTYRVLFAGEDTGHLIVERDVNRVSVDFDYKQNGRGPTFAEQIVLDERGYPAEWTINGRTTFGNAVDEYFRVDGGVARWRDTTGEGEAAVDGAPHHYVNQEGSFYSLALLTRALLEDADGSIDVYPAGQASIVPGESMTFDGPDGELDVTFYQLYGLDMNPVHIVLDQNREFFAIAGPGFATVRAGYEAADETLRAHAEQLSTDRFVEIQANTAHDYDAPVRIRNVRIFDPAALALTQLSDVVVFRERIASIQPAGSPATEGEFEIEGAGGTLVPGMYEMHGHLAQDSALLNLAAGITSVRDMGNENDVLAGLIERIENGAIAGPRITRSCFIEGESEFSAAIGETVASLDEALEMVRWCAARGFHQVKLYNSMRGEWAPALVAEAHRLGMRVAGHVPAFSSVDAMIAAGFDEITHANQLMLGWVLNEGEDTRTLFRFTAMQRFPELDLDGAAVQATLQNMRARGVAHDPTIAIHEFGLTAVDGDVVPHARAVNDHLPTNVQRANRTALFGADSLQERARYIEAYGVIVQTLRRMHESGILLVPGTDLGGSFAYHRELELFGSLGMSPAEVLRRATLEMADYLGQAEDLGSIERGKYADFFLVPGDPSTDLTRLREISMVVANGTVYFPGEIYPWFGIRPFTDTPEVTAPTGSGEPAGAGD